MSRPNYKDVSWSKTVVAPVVKNNKLSTTNFLLHTLYSCPNAPVSGKTTSTLYHVATAGYINNIPVSGY